VKLMSDHLDGIERRALIPEAVRDGRDLSAVLSRYAQDVEPGLAVDGPVTPLKSSTRARMGAR
jgi:hypothetical protein